ncbi:hypothetical protein K469DRAFT_692147 [Zopfia rhizophila CBS 207.26]|uniref:Uncharacterized protein n=1 Tax=Zopfia rhizophila CBS 207.26 TaxID=1314779 RepID=A0A6A6DUC5_9PEZI|nr:hypothetical protein K469DRAFT_692147 [Zopfia rhizophila CBS 207.26]
MDPQQACERLAPLNVSHPQQFDPNGLGLYIERTNGMFADLSTLVRSITERVASLHQQTATAFNPLPEHIAQKNDQLDQLYQAYYGEYRRSQELRCGNQQLQDHIESMRNSLLREQEHDQYTRTELALLRHTLEEEQGNKAALEERNTELCDIVTRHESTNKELQRLVEVMEEHKTALERDNQALNATTKQHHKEPERTDTEGMDVTSCQEVDEGINFGGMSLEDRVKVLEAEKGALEKNLQEANDATAACKMELEEVRSRPSRGRRQRKKRET